MLKDGAKVYKMKYVQEEVRNDTQYSVNIIAMSWNDAENYLRAQFKNKIRVEERGGTWDINVITPAAIMPVKPQVIEKVIIKSGDKDAVKDDSITCPWCDKPFKNTITLQTHIKKLHMDK